MSTPQKDKPSTPQEKKKGFEKYVERFKRALGKSDSNRQRHSMPVVAKPVATVASSPTPPTASSSKPTGETPTAQPVAEPTKIPLNGEIGPAADRVAKEVRVRVHRECHECKEDFGTKQVCGNCSHKRCHECPRFPPKKTGVADSVINVSHKKGERYRLHITKPAKTSQQNLVMKKVVQRVRRNCHCCGTLFYPPTKTCTECGHTRCTDCPRDPPKPQKFPYGYPNDAPGEKNAYYTCHECENVFPLDESRCTKCTHEKCADCARTLPRKVEPQPDPEVLRRVEEKLAKFALNAVA